MFLLIIGGRHCILQKRKAFNFLLKNFSLFLENINRSKENYGRAKMFGYR